MSIGGKFPFEENRWINSGHAIIGRKGGNQDNKFPWITEQIDVWVKEKDDTPWIEANIPLLSGGTKP